MYNFLCNIFPNGAVALGSEVICDGFKEGYPFRIQTHIHDDHMSGFDKSRGFQDLLMTRGTYELLVAERNADLPFRDNFNWIPNNEDHKINDHLTLSLFSSNHMLGACQVLLKLYDGYRVGYSGDFGWPIDHIIQVDELVVDSTYGNPRSIRNYTQDEAEECFLSLVLQRLRYGPVHVKAFRGTIERVLHIIGGNVHVPILASPRLITEIRVYQKYGFAVANLHSLDSEIAQHAIKEKYYIRLYSKGDGFGNEPTGQSTITCSAYRLIGSTQPFLAYSDNSYQVGLSNHADFNETLEYVERTGAKKIITNNTQGHGRDLAIEINRRLKGVSAEPRPI